MTAAAFHRREEADPPHPAGGIAGGAKGRPCTTMPESLPTHIAPEGESGQITPIGGMSDEDSGVLIGEVIDRFGGRFSAQVGIDVDRNDHEIERWFLAATLFGNRIGSNIAVRTYRVLDGFGLSAITDVASCDRDDLIELLDRGRYVHYDYRMASRLLALAEHAPRLLPDGVGGLLTCTPEPERLRVALENLPGWGPVTTRVFLRELRGIRPGADLPVDPLAACSARHLGLGRLPFDARELHRCAGLATVDVRDLEAALVRVALAHHRSFDTCETRSPGRCEFLASDDHHLEGFPLAPRNGTRAARVLRIDSGIHSQR